MIVLVKGQQNRKKGQTCNLKNKKMVVIKNNSFDSIKLFFLLEKGLILDVCVFNSACSIHQVEQFYFPKKSKF